MNKEFRQDLKAIVDYCSDFEVEHFFQSCTCEPTLNEDGVDIYLCEWEDIDKCSCDENKNHIMKAIKRVSDRLDLEE